MCFMRNCKICAAIRKNRRLYEKIKDMEDNEKQVRSGEEREREVNKSWTDRWRSAKLSPSARHDPFQRHVGSNQRAKKSRAMEEGGREGGRRLHPKICGPTGNTRTLLVTSRWMLRAYTGPPCRQRVCISYDTKTSHYFPLSLERAASPAFFLLFSSARRPRACDHHYARPPSLVPISPSRSPSHPPPQTSFLPSSCSLPIPPLGYLLPQITYPLNESRRKRCSPVTG